MFAQPIAEGRAIESCSVFHAPRLADGHLLAEAVELPGDLGKVDALSKADVG